MDPAAGAVFLEIRHQKPALNGADIGLRPLDALLNAYKTVWREGRHDGSVWVIQGEFDPSNSLAEYNSRIAPRHQHAHVVTRRQGLVRLLDSSQPNNSLLQNLHTPVHPGKRLLFDSPLEAEHGGWAAVSQ